MAIQDAEHDRMIRNFLDFGLLQAELKMRNNAEDFLISGNLPNLKNGATQASRIQSRFAKLIADLTTDLGTPAAALIALDAGLARNATMTRPEIIAHMATLRVIEDACFNGITNLAWTNDDVANYINANTKDNERLYKLTEEAGWVPDWQ